MVVLTYVNVVDVFVRDYGYDIPGRQGRGRWPPEGVRGATGGRGATWSQLGCVCPKMKDMGFFSASRERDEWE